MSDAESLIAVAFLFSLLACFVTLRERSSGFYFLRPALMGNLGFSALVAWPSYGISWRAFLFYLALGLGATEGGVWAGLALDRMLPERVAGQKSWAWSNDRWGCGLVVVIAIALITVLTLLPGDEEL